ncbi:flavin reductase family protein [Microbacterium album]|uniref:Oxidoreductase n=1 Tax=Microbacterium album TaxID=2053191 RepID=A0A917IFC9_9MICO|nr:flavin reductase family protein [Microbacterium album]GGH43131.1 putative oxidoreductase [Microbacterium album]
MLERRGVDPGLLRQTFSLFPSGVACIGAVVEGQSEALVASSFTVGVSLDPPLVSFAVQNTSTTWPLIRGADRIGVSVMASDHDAICRQIASKDRSRRFEGVETHVAESGALFLLGSPVWLECALYSEVPAGDHSLVLLEVDGLGLNPDLRPLVFHASAFTSVRDG